MVAIAHPCFTKSNNTYNLIIIIIIHLFVLQCVQLILNNVYWVHKTESNESNSSLIKKEVLCAFSALYNTSFANETLFNRIRW